MIEENDTYIVAVKRSSRDAAPEDWATRLADLDGVEVCSAPPNSRRVQIRATAKGVSDVREQLGEAFHVEPVVRHQPLSQSVQPDTSTPAIPPPAAPEKSGAEPGDSEPPRSPDRDP